MTEFLLWSMLMAPLVLAVLHTVEPLRRWALRLTPCAPLPAIALLLSGNTFTLDVPWLLLGARFGLDDIGRVFLGLTATLWLAAGIFAQAYLARDAHRERFAFHFLVTLAGNLGVTVALDMASFLTSFTLMSLGAYGLITHDRQATSMRAGRIYMAMTIGGEILLFAATIVLVHETGSPYFAEIPGALARSSRPDVVIGLLCAGFGIKLGMIPLHVWLPLAHPAAPTPASAVLSGAIIKTGLLGLLRTLPLGIIAVPDWGGILLWTGFTACLAGALMGTAQSNPKTVLAYSSISQMGLITMALGMALTAPDTWPLVLPALLLLTVHHGIAKGALFLGVGVASARIRLLWCRLFVQGGLLLAALALAGLPLTMGYVAKAALKYSAAATDHGSELVWLLQLTSLVTTLVVSRFLWLVWPHRRSGHGALAVGMVGPWAVLSAAVVVGFLVLRWHGLPRGSWVSLHPPSLWSSAWPLAVAGLIVACILARPGLRQRIAWIRVPEGDVVVPCLAAARWCGRHWNLIAVIHLPQWFHAPRRKLIEKLTGAAQHLISRLSSALENDLTAGLMIVLLFLVLVAVSLW